MLGQAWRSLLLTVAVLAGARPAPAQPPGSELAKLGEHVLTVRDGLPAEQVLGFYEDARGALWIGTVDGLARLATPGMRVYDVTDGLPRRVVYALTEDERGVLYAGTVNGVARYDPAADRFTDSGLQAGGRVRAFLRGGGGRDLYAVLLPARVHRLRGGAWSAVELRGAPEGVVINGAALDGRGRLLAATRQHGLLAFEPEGDGFRLAERWDGAPLFPEGYAYNVVATRDALIATSRDGVVTIGEAGARRVPLPGGIGLRPLAAGVDGTVYAGSDAGLYRVQDGALLPLTGLRGLRDVNPVTLMVDRGGNLWCGTVARGAFVLRTNLPVLHYLGPGGVPGDHVLSVVPLGRGRAWIFTDRGGYELLHDADGRPLSLARIDPTAPAGRPGGEAFAFLSSDEALVSSWNGILRVTQLREPDRRRFTWDERFAALRGAYVSAIALGPDRSVWVGGADGLHVLEPGRPLRRIAVETSDHRIRAVAPLASGPVVVLTSSGELFWVRGPRGEAQRIEVPAQGRELVVAPDGRAWVSLDDGATRVLDAAADGSPRVVVELARDGPLSGLSVPSLTALPDGGWLVAHARGVGRLDPERVVETERWLSSSDLDEVQLGRLAAATDEEGAVWLYTLRGLARFQPAGFHPPPAPRLHVERFAVNGRALAPAEGGVIPLGSSHLVELTLALPDATAPRTALFRYRLGGEDDPWSAWSTSNVFRFGTLRPGQVRLDVEGQDRLGRAVSPLSLRFQVAPAWWRSPAALVSWAALAAAAVALFVRRRTRELVRRQAELEQKVAEATRDLGEANALLASSNEALRKLDEMRTEFLAIAAHDLRNPLTVVSGTADLLLEQARRAERVPGGTVADLRESAEFIRRSARQMSAIVGHLLETAALDGGEVRLDRRPLDVGELAERVAEAQRGSAARKQIDIVVASRGDTRALVDEVRVQEVLENLVSNAVKFSPPGRPVSLEVEQPAESPERVRITVRDQGPGLTPQDKARLFGRFQRLTARPTGGETSTGLGLFIVKRLVELHGGKVWADGEPGRGSTFVVELPGGA